ncbi:MAG: RNA-directed DNA polymerase [Chloroflexi bacterium]|nr:RNA-directed DNA polymerase [Chloroflexota bacterium]
MADSNFAPASDGELGRSVIELSADEAREFFLKKETYCSIELPLYFDFSKILHDGAAVLEGQQLSSLRTANPRTVDNVNYAILHNKDGRYAWRPLELVHPALYVALVHSLTEPCHWSLICDRFSQFKSRAGIKCLSLPAQESTNEQDEAVQRSALWSSVERTSIELALDYEFVIHTDIVDCYAAIYTHSIAWALHTKSEAKANRDEHSLVGNVIDNRILDMQQGQTNGIPQGSVLMDFIAEMVLGYADLELANKIDSSSIRGFQILRYRDDYRIFVNNPQDGERILKCLTEVMIDLGLKLNPSKTQVSSEVIRSAIKTDRLNWAFRTHNHGDLQRYLMTIHDHSLKHPNAGSVNRALKDFHKLLLEADTDHSPLPLISIVTDIAYRNPKTQAIAAATLSQLIDCLQADSERKDAIERIYRKFAQIPNTGHMQVWLQRISYPFFPDLHLDELLCRLVAQRDRPPEIWGSNWISSSPLRTAINANKMIDRDKLDTIDPVVSADEVEQSISNRWLYY